MAWLTPVGQSLPQEVYQVAQDHQLGAPLREYQGVNPWWVTVLAMAALLGLLGFCILTRFPLPPLVFALLAGLFVLLATLAYYRAGQWANQREWRIFGCTGGLV